MLLTTPLVLSTLYKILIVLIVTDVTSWWTCVTIVVLFVLFFRFLMHEASSTMATMAVETSTHSAIAFKLHISADKDIRQLWKRSGPTMLAQKQRMKKQFYHWVSNGSGCSHGMSWSVKTVKNLKKPRETEFVLHVLVVFFNAYILMWSYNI